MARIDWIEQRLQNWARWKLTRGGGVQGYAGVNFAALGGANAGRDGYVESVVPINELEAGATDTAIDTLAPDLQRAVRAWYLRREGKVQAAAEAGCAVSTMFARIDLAHMKLAQHFSDQARRASDERARVESLQTAVRPRI